MSDKKNSRSDSERIILDSWKEISSYLERSEKTCRKWERDFNLPIHRLEDSPKARVFAYTDELNKWWENHLRQINVRNTKRNNKRRPQLIFLTWPVLILLVFITIYFVFFKRGEQVSSRPDSKDISLGVLYIENQSGDENLDVWRVALAELIITDLSQSRYIRVLRSDEIYSLMKKLNLVNINRYSKEDVKNIASLGKVDHILKGSFIRTGQFLILTMTLCEMKSQRTIHSFSVKSDGFDQLFQAVDLITTRVKRGLYMTPEEILRDDDKKIGNITTQSPEAYVKAIKGNHYMYQGDFDQAEVMYNSAIAIDPDFAFSHYILGNIYWLSGRRMKGVASYRRAYELSEQLPAWERYSIKRTCNYFFGEPYWDEAFKAAYKLQEFYPHDFLNNLSLGNLNMRSGNYQKAISYYQILIGKGDATQYPYILSAINYQLMGDYSKAGKIIKKYLKQFPENGEMIIYNIGNLVLSGEMELALTKFEDSHLIIEKVSHSYISPVILQGDLLRYSGRFRDSERVYKSVAGSLSSPSHRLVVEYRLGTLYKMLGKYSRAETCLKRAAGILKDQEDMGILRMVVFINLSQIERLKRGYPGSSLYKDEVLKGAEQSQDWELKVHALHNICLGLMIQDDKTKFKNRLSEMKRFITAGKNRKRIRYFFHLKGMMAMKEKDFSTAVDLLERAVSQLPSEYDSRCLYLSFYQDQALFLNSLAEAYERSGRIDEACSAYEKISNLTFGRSDSGDLYSKAHYHLGRIYLKLNKNKNARHCFRSFVNLWKDCDPEFQYMVEDARKKIKTL